MVRTAETNMDSAQNDLGYGFDLDICYAKPSILDSLYWQDILKIHEFKRRDVDTFAFMYGTKKLWGHVHYTASARVDSLNRPVQTSMRAGVGLGVKAPSYKAGLFRSR
ncbi:MAG: hypothetical protein WCA08_10945 [Desulfoferrobacter sp.]